MLSGLLQIIYMSILNAKNFEHLIDAFDLLIDRRCSQKCILTSKLSYLLVILEQIQQNKLFAWKVRLYVAQWKPALMNFI